MKMSNHNQSLYDHYESVIRDQKRKIDELKETLELAIAAAQKAEAELIDSIAMGPSRGIK